MKKSKAFEAAGRYRLSSCCVAKYVVLFQSTNRMWICNLEGIWVFLFLDHLGADCIKFAEWRNLIPCLGTHQFIPTHVQLIFKNNTCNYLIITASDIQAFACFLVVWVCFGFIKKISPTRRHIPESKISTNKMFILV